MNDCGGTFFSEKEFPRTPSKKHSHKGSKNKFISSLIDGRRERKARFCCRKRLEATNPIRSESCLTSCILKCNVVKCKQKGGDRMDIKRKSNSKIEEMITDAAFLYQQPWFYNQPFALRCELGIGKSTRIYLKNAKKRAYKIFDILFQNAPDAIFFDYCIEDLTTWEEINAKSRTKCFEKDSKFLAKHINNYDCSIIRNIELDGDEKDFYTQKNRIICYTDKKYPYKKRIVENFSWASRTVHFVSFENECILSIYDDRGCDIVFATKEKMCEFYPKLEHYLLTYDLAEMQKRINE